MTSTVFTSGGYKLDTVGKIDLVKAPAGGTPDSFSGLRREPSEYVIGVPNVLGSIHNSSDQQLQGKAKVVPGQGQVTCRPGSGQNLGLGSGQEENWVSFGAQTPQGKPMGGEGTTPVKSKTLLGQTNRNMGKTDLGVHNTIKQPRDDVVGGREVRGAATAAVMGAQSSEHSPDCKRGNIRKGPGHSPTQTSCIRQILLLQLELIEQQQQQLQSKSKEIDDLKAEKEMLMARIERMERRLRLGKKDGCDQHPTHIPSRQQDQAAMPGTPEGQGLSEGRSGHTPRTLNFGRGGKGHKRRFLFQDPRAAKRRAQAKASQSPHNEALLPKEEPLDGGEFSDGSPGTSSTVTEELDYLSTTDMYLCRWHVPPLSPTSREPSPKKEEPVAIPSWKENLMGPLGEEEASDIPENLDDNVFLKRHLKHELDEKRRKRWDIQRIREQRMFQRLQQRMNKRKGIQESEPEVFSFYPEAEDVEYLMITPHLPVVVFGRPLPKLSRRIFDLPWLDERSRCRVEVPKKQTPHRTCRK
uniref:male-specific lethal 1-like 1 n=1 Tax=Oncorhynchus gorbuscha TaxID=8017 RepID=UPI001EAE8E16|nr:male-specific lethal 1-like 1 [Oncorhynchus gorbuscha]XP_046186179.1 male-specific lethal 1-like 1 [Oncorhynchus gorbuscha]